jgi:C4-dicarboxylate-specific signal transduction histidine kinase
MAFWVLAIAGLQLLWWPNLASRLAFASASLIPACFLAFTRVYPSAGDAWRTSPVWISLGLGTALATFALATDLVVYDVHVVESTPRRQTGPLYRVFAVYFVTVWLGALATFIGKWRRARGLARVQLQHLGIGVVISGAGAMTTNLLIPLLTGSSVFSGLGPYFLIPMVGLVAHAIVRHRLLDLRPVIHHGLALAIGIAALSTAIVAIARQAGLMSVQAPTALVIALAVTAVVFSAPVYPGVRRVIDRYLLSEQPNVGRTLVEATTRLMRVMPREQLVAEIVRLVRAAVQPQTITLLICDVGKNRWEILYREHNGVNFETTLPQGLEVRQTFGPGVYLLEAGANEEKTTAVFCRLREAGVEVWMGLGREAVVGVLLLGPRQVRRAYFAQQLKFLEALGPIVAAALEIDILHQRQLELERARARDAHLAQARAESLANLQRITQALAHEIGNPLTPIKALAKLLPERRNDPGFAENLSRIVARELERIERLVARLRRVAPRTEPNHSRLDLRLPMRHALEVIEATAAEQETRLKIALDASVVPILGDAAELEELFLNLLTNALDAVADQPANARCVQVTVAVQDSYAVANVRDSGRGIAADVIDRIFDPFVTTKPRGSGLGLAICGGIVERHRGRVTAANAETGGAVFTVILPLAPGRSRVGASDAPEAVDPPYSGAS